MSIGKRPPRPASTLDSNGRERADRIENATRLLVEHEVVRLDRHGRAQALVITPGYRLRAPSE
jgi:hypothetical protein